MAKKKDKKPKGKRIKVAKVKRKKPKRSKKRKRRTRGKGQYSDFFPTNRQIDSNQYWQLRAEIAGAEARVGVSQKDRKVEEEKKDEEVRKLRREVDDLKQSSDRLEETVRSDQGSTRYEDETVRATRRQRRRRAKTPFVGEQSSIPQVGSTGSSEDYVGFRQPGFDTSQRSAKTEQFTSGPSTDEYSSTDDAEKWRNITHQAAKNQSIYTARAPRRRRRRSSLGAISEAKFDALDESGKLSAFREGLNAKRQARADKLLDETQQKGQRGGGVRNPARWERHSIRDDTQVPEPEPQPEPSKPVSQSKLGKLRAHQEEMEARAKLRGKTRGGSESEYGGESSDYEKE